MHEIRTRPSTSRALAAGSLLALLLGACTDVAQPDPTPEQTVSAAPTVTPPTPQADPAEPTPRGTPAASSTAPPGGMFVDQEVTFDGYGPITIGATRGEVETIAGRLIPLTCDEEAADLSFVYGMNLVLRDDAVVRIDVVDQPDGGEGGPIATVAGVASPGSTEDLQAAFAAAGVATSITTDTGGQRLLLAENGTGRAIAAYLYDDDSMFGRVSTGLTDELTGRILCD
jgi:hypothetical protein